MSEGAYAVAAAACAFAGVAAAALWAAMRICRAIVPFDDGPPAGRPPSTLLIGGAAAIGFSLALHGASGAALGLDALLIAALAGCWYSDVRCGIVPDVFTLVPLGVVVVVELVARNPWPLCSAALVFAPFALVAAASRGIGMGWGDAKLAALGGAMLGATTSILSFTAACFVAAAVSFICRRRRGPIAFAPYLAGSIALALAVPGI